jgi:hypothetical protein
MKVIVNKPVHLPVSSVVAHKIIDIRIVDVPWWENMNFGIQEQKGLNFTREGD